MAETAVSLDDKYALESGRVYLTGTQALVRLPMIQRQRDLADRTFDELRRQRRRVLLVVLFGLLLDQSAQIFVTSWVGIVVSHTSTYRNLVVGPLFRTSVLKYCNVNVVNGYPSVSRTIGTTHVTFSTEGTLAVAISCFPLEGAVKTQEYN